MANSGGESRMCFRRLWRGEGEELAGFLGGACLVDPDLRKEIDSPVASHEKAAY